MIGKGSLYVCGRLFECWPLVSRWPFSAHYACHGVLGILYSVLWWRKEWHRTLEVDVFIFYKHWRSLQKAKKTIFYIRAKKQSHQNKDTKTICWSNHIHVFNANVHFLKACRIATDCQYIKLWVKLHTTQAWCVYYAFDGGKIIIFRCMQTIISQGVDFTAAMHPTRAAN